MISAEHFSNDVLEFLLLLKKHKVKYVIIGGEAVIYYGFARLTGDIDLLYDRQPENVDLLYDALLEFWQGNIPGLDDKDELFDQDAVFQFGVPPNRIDLLSDITAVRFESAWEQKKVENIKVDNKVIEIYFVGLEHLIENKRTIGRPKDQEDLKYLQAIKKKSE